MSMVYLKRCDRCQKVSELCNTPNPLGWQSLADTMHGTLASVDLCPECQEQMGIRQMLAGKIRARAISIVRDALGPIDLADLPSVLNIDEIEAKIASGEYDDAFAQGEGVPLDQLLQDTVPQLGELVDD